MHEDSCRDCVARRPVQSLVANLAEEPSNGPLHCQRGIDSLHVGTSLLRVEAVALLLEDKLVNVHVSLRRELAA